MMFWIGAAMYVIGLAMIPGDSWRVLVGGLLCYYGGCFVGAATPLDSARRGKDRRDA